MNTMPSPPMLLVPDDVEALILHLPYFTFARQTSARRHIAALIRNGEELAEVLAQYPAMKYEPLDEHYVLLNCLGGMSEALISDLCAHYGGWRGVVLAALLAALAPAASYRPHLVAAYDSVPHNQWLIDLALAEIDGTQWHADIELQTLMRRLRALLATAPLPASVFRPFPDIRQCEAERAKVAHAYRSGGLEAALAEFANTTILRSLARRR